MEDHIADLQIVITWTYATKAAEPECALIEYAVTSSEALHIWQHNRVILLVIHFESHCNWLTSLCSTEQTAVKKPKRALSYSGKKPKLDAHPEQAVFVHPCGFGKKTAKYSLIQVKCDTTFERNLGCNLR